MRGRLYASGDRAREALVRGVDLVADLVGPTLGPRGRHVVVQRLDAPPLITNDGVTIARALEMLRDPMTNQGVQLVKEVSSTTEDVVGDGTTTAALLARAIVRAAFTRCVAGANPVALTRGIDAAVGEVVAWLTERSAPGQDPAVVARVGAVAARDPKIGTMVAEALGAVGADGVVRLEDDTAFGVRLAIHRGMRFDGGLISPALAVDTTALETAFDDPYLLLADERISEVDQLVPVLSAVAAERRPLVIIADEISGEALRLLIANVRRRGLPVAAVKAPLFGPDRSAALEDMAIRTGGLVHGGTTGRSVRRAGLDALGRAARVVVAADTTSVIEGRGDHASIAARAREIRAAIAYEGSEYERDKLRTRLARLDGALAIVSIGLDSDTEQEETRHRIHDAVQAGRAAIRGGILPGGGAALVKAAGHLQAAGEGDEAAGRAVVRRALEAPLRQLAHNAGLEPSVAVEQVASTPFAQGLDMERLELCDLVEAGIFDATEVVCATLQIAASIARTCIHSEAIIAHPPLVIPRRPHHPHGHHHHGDPEGHTHGHHHHGAPEPAGAAQ
jgi:chaperonin GroEL